MSPIQQQVPATVDVLRLWAPVIQATAAVLAAAFVAIQIRLIRRAREVDTFIRLVGAANEEYLRTAANWVKYDLSSSLGYEAVRADRAAWEKVASVTHYFEMVGVLVTTGHIPEGLVFDQMGPWIAGTWHKLAKLIQGHRVARKAPDYCENFELLNAAYERWSKRNPPKLENRPRVSSATAQHYYDVSGSPRETNDPPRP